MWYTYSKLNWSTLWSANVFSKWPSTSSKYVGLNRAYVVSVAITQLYPYNIKAARDNI